MNPLFPQMIKAMRYRFYCFRLSVKLEPCEIIHHLLCSIPLPNLLTPFQIHVHRSAFLNEIQENLACSRALIEFLSISKSSAMWTAYYLIFHVQVVLLLMHSLLYTRLHVCLHSVLSSWDVVFLCLVLLSRRPFQTESLIFWKVSFSILKLKGDIIYS